MKIINRIFIKYYPSLLTALFLLLVAVYLSTTLFSQDKKMSNNHKNLSENYNELTPEEKQVILYKGTERPYTGKFYEHDEKGIYTCKRCDAPLYRSEDKFDSHCGWPSFDDEVEGAVKRRRDADGFRTEILCNNCGAHLGHVFLGENFTSKNTRHCVNSISMNFVPAENIQRAYFAGGCFWGVEYHFQHLNGVLFTEVGYMGGEKNEPTYRQVCTGNTGHAETLEVVFNTEKTDFETLAKLFFEIHDPTQKNRQGPDMGDQYRSAVYYTNENQKQVTKKLIQILMDKGYTVVTQVEKAEQFWPAEDYHQEYYSKKGQQPYCHIYQKRF